MAVFLLLLLLLFDILGVFIGGAQAFSGIPPAQRHSCPQEYGILLIVSQPGIEPMSSALQGRFLTNWSTGSP